MVFDEFYLSRITQSWISSIFPCRWYRPTSTNLRIVINFHFFLVQNRSIHPMHRWLEFLFIPTTTTKSVSCLFCSQGEVQNTQNQASITISSIEILLTHHHQSHAYDPKQETTNRYTKTDHLAASQSILFLSHISRSFYLVLCLIREFI